MSIKRLIVTGLFVISTNSWASMFGEENITLGAILSNTAQQVKILREQLLQAQESIEEIRSVNEGYRRVLGQIYYEAQWMKEIDSINELEDVLFGVENILNHGSNLSKLTQKKFSKIKSGYELSRNSLKFSSVLYEQGRKNEIISSGASPGLSEKLTAQNTSLILQALSSLQKTQSELLKHSLSKQIDQIHDEVFVKQAIGQNKQGKASPKISWAVKEKKYFKGRPY